MRTFLLRVIFCIIFKHSMRELAQTSIRANGKNSNNSPSNYPFFPYHNSFACQQYLAQRKNYNKEFYVNVCINKYPMRDKS